MVLYRFIWRHPSFFMHILMIESALIILMLFSTQTVLIFPIWMFTNFPSHCFSIFLLSSCTNIEATCSETRSRLIISTFFSFLNISSFSPHLHIQGVLHKNLRLYILRTNRNIEILYTPSFLAWSWLRNIKFYPLGSFQKSEQEFEDLLVKPYLLNQWETKEKS